MNKGNSLKLIKYILLGLLIFIASILIAIITRVTLVADGRLAFFSDDQGVLVASIIGGAVASLAAGFVLYQLKNEQDLRIQENEIRKSEFIQHFANYWLETDKLFIQYPECRKYFYNKSDPSYLDKSSEEYQRIITIAEYFGDLFQYSKVEVDRAETSIPAAMKDSYLNYIDFIEASPGYKLYGMTWTKNQPNEMEN
jgi:hypothetical protein